MNVTTDTLFKQGAEGRLYKIDFFGKPAVLKERFRKKYRNEELDIRLTKERIRAEAKSILRCQNAGICTPAVYSVNFETRRIVMEYIANSKTVSERIYELTATINDENTTELRSIANRMGLLIARMHCHSIIHGDLTTSNILVKFENDGSWELFLIDFGLSYAKSSDEDKAVDLYVLERALTSKHSDVSWFFEEFLKAYTTFDKNCIRVVKKFQEVRSRGRKRTMLG